MGNLVTLVHNLKNGDFLSLTAEIAVLNAVLLHCEDVCKGTFLIYKICNMGLRGFFVVENIRRKVCVMSLYCLFTGLWPLKTDFMDRVWILIAWQNIFFILSNLDWQELFYPFSWVHHHASLSFLDLGCLPAVSLHCSIALGSVCLHSPPKCKVGVGHSCLELKGLCSTQAKSKLLHQCSKALFEQGQYSVVTPSILHSMETSSFNSMMLFLLV